VNNYQQQCLNEQREFEERLCKMEREVEQGRKLLENLTETEKVTEDAHKRHDI